jgi:ribonuclease HI
MKFYAYEIYFTGEKGIVTNWDECKQKTHGVNARFKSFPTRDAAEKWLGVETKITNNNNPFKLKDGVYFDAGTGRGIGVEVKVTDKNGTSLLDVFADKLKITKHDTYLAPKGSTNNYGELIGLYLAIMYSMMNDNKNIYGDSKLVIDYWSKGKMNKKNLNDKTINLIEKTKILRKQFEQLGGKIEYVSGDINPADLGFHRG